MCIVVPNFAAIGRTVADYSDLTIFKMAAVRYLGFVTRMFGPPTKIICGHSSMCKIWLDSVQCFRQCATFNIVRVKLEMRVYAPKSGFLPRS